MTIRRLATDAVLIPPLIGLRIAFLALVEVQEILETLDARLERLT